MRRLKSAKPDSVFGIGATYHSRKYNGENYNGDNYTCCRSLIICARLTSKSLEAPPALCQSSATAAGVSRAHVPGESPILVRTENDRV